MRRREGDVLQRLFVNVENQLSVLERAAKILASQFPIATSQQEFYQHICFPPSERPAETLRIEKMDGVGKPRQGRFHLMGIGTRIRSIPEFDCRYF